jgi:hypothetical protein
MSSSPEPPRASGVSLFLGVTLVGVALVVAGVVRSSTLIGVNGLTMAVVGLVVARSLLDPAE